MIEELKLGTASAGARHALRNGIVIARSPIPRSLLQETYGLLEDFFKLPRAAKMTCHAPGTNGQAGYTPALIETAERSSKPDWKEIYHWGKALSHQHPLRQRYPARYPDQVLPDALVPGIGAAMTRLHSAMLDFQLSVAETIGEAFGIGPTYFREMLEDGPVVNRAAWYPPMAQAPSEGHVWAVEHQDFDLITAMPPATSSGLEILLNGTWQAVSPPEDYAIVIAGMVMERLTGGLMPAVFHRVTALSGQDYGRLSIVQFCHPAPWTVLTPLNLGDDGMNGTPIPTLTAGDLFDRTMYRINRMDADSASAETGPR